MRDSCLTNTSNKMSCRYIKTNDMKTMKTIFTVLLFLSASFMNGQESKTITKEDKKKYYQKRAKEDAEFEQQFKVKSKSEEKKFWKEQKNYEKELKRKDKVAYEAYMEGKRDAYAEHRTHCDSHCHHGYYYEYHARFYFSGHYEYESRRYRRSSGTSIRIGTPSVRLRIF